MAIFKEFCEKCRKDTYHAEMGYNKLICLKCANSIYLHKINIKESVPEKHKRIKPKIKMIRRRTIYNPPECNYCLGDLKYGVSEVIKNGFRKTLNRGRIQKYKCLHCGHRFIDDDNYRMRLNEKTITKILDLRENNLSYREISNLITSVSHTTVSRICAKYLEGI